jgi:anaerobic selenocysteine-containing dehydrogenase
MDGHVTTDFLKWSGGTALTGTPLGGLVAVGAGLGPTLAQAQAPRIEHARAIPSVCPYCAVGCAMPAAAGNEGPAFFPQDQERAAAGRADGASMASRYKPCSRLMYDRT